MDGAERVAKRQRGDDGERDATRRRNAVHRELVAARLREQLDPHRLRVALDELGSIVSDADAACVEFSMFEALDELMAQVCGERRTVPVCRAFSSCKTHQSSRRRWSTIRTSGL